MRWFKHMTDTRSDEKIARLLDAQGLAGYGLWWRILETVAGQMKKTRGRNVQSATRSQVGRGLVATSCNVRRSLATMGDRPAGDHRE
jgi:hypothetical protein